MKLPLLGSGARRRTTAATVLLLAGVLLLSGSVAALAASGVAAILQSNEVIEAPEELLAPQEECTSYVVVPTHDEAGQLIIEEQIAALPADVRCFSYMFPDQDAEANEEISRWYCQFTERPLVNCSEEFITTPIPLDGCDPVFDGNGRIIGRECTARERALLRDAYDEINQQIAEGQRCGVVPEFEGLPDFEDLWILWSDPDSEGMSIGCEPPPTNCVTDLGDPAWCTDANVPPDTPPSAAASPDPIDRVIDCFDEYPGAPCEVREYRRSTGELLRTYLIDRSEVPEGRDEAMPSASPEPSPEASE